MIVSRLRNNLAAAKMLRSSGVTLPSILLFPVKRRMRLPRKLLIFESGLSITAPPKEPILNLFREIWVERCYEPRAYETTPSSLGVVIDIGAHAGTFTLWVKKHWPLMRVIALEPSDRMFWCLRENVKNNLLQNVTPLQIGCAGQSGVRLLYSRGNEAMNTMYARDNYESNPIFKQHMKVWSLNDLFDRLQINNCKLLKLDCEGAEYEILLNAGEETLSKIDCISMEYHVGLNEYGPAKLEPFLRAKGFRVTILPLFDLEGGYLYAQRNIAGKSPQTPMEARREARRATKDGRTA
jgi:FkbM family methyltransferase